MATLSLDILITGPSGSGKEHIAKLIHQRSGRSGAWVPVNCASLSSELGEAELFGHKKGAFTGANRDNPGLVRAAQGGTLFLDEVAELDLRVQAKLLRFLEERQYRPLGTQTEVQADVRVLAATCRPLLQLVESGAFRSDLYQRLAGYILTVPSLRERASDIVPLARHFLKEDVVCKDYRARLSRDAATLLRLAPWPGNIRELRRILRSILLEEAPKTIHEGHVGRALGWRDPKSMLPEKFSSREAILRALRTQGSLGSAGLVRRTGLSRSTVSRALRHLHDEGEIERIGEGPKGRYRLPNQPSMAEPDLPEHLREVRALIQRRSSLRSSELAQSLGISPRTATRWLSQLVDLGQAKATGGSRRGRRYEPI